MIGFHIPVFSPFTVWQKFAHMSTNEFVESADVKPALIQILPLTFPTFTHLTLSFNVPIYTAEILIVLIS